MRDVSADLQQRDCKPLCPANASGTSEARDSQFSDAIWLIYFKHLPQELITAGLWRTVLALQTVFKVDYKKKHSVSLERQYR